MTRIRIALAGILLAMSTGAAVVEDPLPPAAGLQVGTSHR